MSYVKHRITRLSLLLLLGLVIFLAGCTGGGANTALTGSSWPGIVATDDLIYVAFEQEVIAIEAGSDQVAWVYPRSPSRKQTFFAAPAVDNDLLVIADYESSVIGLDPQTGDERWVYENKPSRYIASPVLDENRVYIASSNGILRALGRNDGAVLWEFQAERELWSAPLLTDGILYIGSLDKHVYAIDAATGEKLWRFPENAGDEGEVSMGAIAGTPAIHGDTIYFGSFNNQLYAVDITTHQVRWTYPTENWLWGELVIDEESGTLLGGDLGGLIFALDLENGQAFWTAKAEGPVVDAPVVEEQEDGSRYVYFISYDDNTDSAEADTILYVLDIEDGSIIQESKSLTGVFDKKFIFFSTGSDVRPIPVYAPPILTDDLVVIGAHQGDFLLYGLDRETLSTEWEFAADGAGRTVAEGGDSETPEETPTQRTLGWLLPAMVGLLLVQMLLQNRNRDKK